MSSFVSLVFSTVGRMRDYTHVVYKHLAYCYLRRGVFLTVMLWSVYVVV